MHDNWHIVDVIYMHLHVAALPWYNTILFYKLIIVDILWLF